MNNKLTILLKKIFLIIGLLIVNTAAQANCVDNVVLVHGNSGSPSDWDTTYELLLTKGYSSNQIYRPSWGSGYASNNDHSGSEELPVLNDINSALNTSCTGKIDVIGHSMGVTLAAQQIIKLNKSAQVDTFVGVKNKFAFKKIHIIAKAALVVHR